MKITKYNYKTFEGKIVEIPSVGEHFFMNVDNAEIFIKEDCEQVRLCGPIIVINNLGDIFNDYLYEYTTINNVDFKFYDKKEISRLLDERINKTKEEFFNNRNK